MHPGTGRRGRELPVGRLAFRPGSRQVVDTTLASVQHTGVAAPKIKVITVLVADDHRTFTDALGIALGMEADLDVHTTIDAGEAAEVAVARQVDVALIDVEMPRIDGIEVMRRIRDGSPTTRVIALSAHEDDLIQAQAMEAGAVGFASKLVSLTELRSLIRRAAAGEILMDSEERARLVRVLHRRRHQQATERQRANRLTARQIQILQMLADGMGPKEVSRTLGVSPLTLRTHVQNILTRLSVHSKVEAIAVAMRQGKVRPIRIA
jgi:DNA-binding NarL/FixJ family response regulator